MLKPLPKSKYLTGMLYFQTEHTLIIYVQYIKDSREKRHIFEKNVISFRDIVRKDLVHFRQNFKRFEFDFSS